MDVNRYLSQIVLKDIFPKGQKIISESSIIVIGVGGTGSAIAEMLVRMGVGKVTIVDDDRVEISNLNRQSLYDEDDLGMEKVIAAKNHLEAINSDVEIVAVNKRLDHVNARDYLAGNNVIMDGTDNYGSRGIINEYSIRLEIPWVFSAVEGYYGYVKAVIPRKTSCLACIGYPLKGESIPCSQTGVLPSAVHTVSSFASTLALRIILGMEVNGELIFIDAWNQSLQKMYLDINPECQVCGVKR
ncbi:MAG: HesA/MoeB/ThiF family protein [Thermoplasmata archaeon]